MDGSTWKHTYKTPKFFVLDARITILRVITMVHFRVWTVAITVIAGVFLYYFEKRWDMSLESSLRLIRSWMVGSDRPAQALEYTKLPVDYDRLFQSFSTSNDTGEPMPFEKKKKNIKKNMTSKKRK